ncbi:rho guanine nucleotide exchange factor 7 isoform X2 [Fopius arisanus]|uniref:Rho guanine nucleotide exchange factor 7 isoform X2 n=1 Tax=Fopius arisanus TaxID=64838 RepID=A0A9R1U6T2_9HYME|nr:PREDICTED: rho guanine nucleotide exchange factor 7 isoform X2 [Fopius arisanus]
MKGDVITITQTDDGGWWEGTLNDKTAWFPSNYVKECRAPDPGHSSGMSSPEKSNAELPVIHSRVNREIVLQDFVDSERANVTEIQGIVNNFLQPLEKTHLLTKEEFKQLIGNIDDIVEVHECLLLNLEAIATQGPDARVGNLFLTLAPRLQSVHLKYCSGHPQAVCIMDRYRDELNDFMEQTGAVTPGILVLTTGLSKPFRRLDKYGAILQELERHTENNHFDRGDTQRSISVYREIAEQCNYIRKQRELALQIFTSGIKGWEGEELNALGEILHVGAVTIAVGTERRDRYFVLFPMTLLVLSTSSRMSSFIYEGKLPLTGIDITLIEETEDSKIAFEISGPFIESITVLCNNREERQQWVNLLSQDQSPSGFFHSPTISHINTPSNVKHQQNLQDHHPLAEIKCWWNLASLRPAPPMYSTKNQNKSDIVNGCQSPRNTNERTFEDDAIILKVIEGYCMIVNRFTMHPDYFDESPNKPTLSLMCSRHMDSFNERTVPEALETLKSQMENLRTQMIQLTKQLNEEKQLRLLLAETIKQRVPGIESLVSYTERPLRES